MNRVLFHIIQQNTSIPLQQLKLLDDPKPQRIAFYSQRFPLFPISINLYLQNPPFNKFCISFDIKFASSKAVLFGSQDGQNYIKFHEILDLSERAQSYTKIFKEKLFFQYVKIVMHEPSKSKQNMCKQIKLRGIQFSLVSFFNTRFACCLHPKFIYHPIIFRLLQVLEYKSLLLQQSKNKLCQKYQKRLQQILTLIESQKFDAIHPEQAILDKFQEQTAYVQNEQVYVDPFYDYPDPIKTKNSINNLQKELQKFEIDRLSKINPHIQHYFQKFQNTDIRERYLRELSSNETQDHNRALIDFWGEVKNLQTFNSRTQEAILMFFNYFLQFIESSLRVPALKILILFNKINPNPKTQSLGPVYQRILHNVIKFIHQQEDEELFNLSIRYCFMIYDRIHNELFLKQLLNSYKSYSLAEQIRKMQILEKITFRGVQIIDRKEIVKFLIGILLVTEITLTQKNRAYNIAAYLASIYGKEAILKDFQQLNSMLIMKMQKNIDNKLGKINRKVEVEEQDYSCEYCGIHNIQFKDENLLDLHIAKQCKYISNCNYCQQNIEIPELFKHYAEQCKMKHEFKHCQNCFEVILIKDEESHNQKCPKKLVTRCPLCYQKMDNKLKLKQHVLIQGCPNNPR